MKVEEFESVDLTLLEFGKAKALAQTLWPKGDPRLLRRALAYPTKPFGFAATAANRAAQFGVTNPLALGYAASVLGSKSHADPAHEFAGDAAAIGATGVGTYAANTLHNKLARGIGHTKDVLSGYHDKNIWDRRPGGPHPFGRGLAPGTTLKDLPKDGTGKVAPIDLDKPGAFTPGAGTTVNVQQNVTGAAEAEIKALNAKIDALDNQLKTFMKAGNTSGTVGARADMDILKNRVDVLELDRAILKKDIAKAVEDGNKNLLKRLKAELLKDFGEEHVKGNTFKKATIDAADGKDWSDPNKKAGTTTAAKQAAAGSADELAAVERLAKQGKTKVTAAEIAKEIENPTVVKAKIDPVTTAYKKEYGGQKGISEPKPDSPEVKLQKAEAAAEKARQIAKAKDASDLAKRNADTLARATEFEEMKAAKAIKNKTGIAIKTGAKTFGTSASSVVIDDVAKLTNAEWLKKLGLYHATGKQAVKQTVKTLARGGAKMLALSFIPVLNVALWGHDAYAITAAAVKSMDPEEQDKSDAGRHRQVALQQMSQVMMSSVSMDEKIDQIDHLFSDSATDTTKQVMLAQIKATQAKELPRGGRQHFVTANPEFQAQLDKGPSKLGPQKVVPRVEDIWNSSYDNEEQLLPVTFDADGNVATGPNTKSDFKDSLDSLIAKQDGYLDWKRLHSNDRSHPIDAKIDAMENAIANVRVAIKSAPEDRQTAFKNYVFAVLAHTETIVANNESAIMKGTLLAEGPRDWLANFKNWATDKENLPKSGGAIRGKTTLAKGVKDLDPSDIEDLTKVKPRHDVEGNVWKRISGMSTKGQPLYDPKLDIKGFKPDTIAQAKQDFVPHKKGGTKKPVLTAKDLEKSAHLRKVFLKTLKDPKGTIDVDDVIAKNAGTKVGSAISKAISNPPSGEEETLGFVPSGKEQKMLDRIKDKSKKYSKYTKVEQALMIKAGLTKNTFKQAHAQASANPDSLKTMKLKNGKILKYFVWNGKKYSV